MNKLNSSKGVGPIGAFILGSGLTVIVGACILFLTFTNHELVPKEQLINMVPLESSAFRIEADVTLDHVYHNGRHVSADFEEDGEALTDETRLDFWFDYEYDADRANMLKTARPNAVYTLTLTEKNDD